MQKPKAWMFFYGFFITREALTRGGLTPRTMWIPKRMNMLACAAAMLPAFVAAVVAADGAATDREIENLAQFARLYGYVRFFHPSDEAAAIDWSKFAVHGAETVRNARDSAALAKSLAQLFEPIATELQISNRDDQKTVEPSAAAPGQRVTFWQHQGVNLSDPTRVAPSRSHLSKIYKSHRVIPGTENGDRAPLFQPAMSPPSVLIAHVGPDISIRMPLVLPVSAEGRTPPGKPADMAALNARLAAVEINKTFEEQWPFRIGCVIITWSVFQHFHPYLDRVGIKWDNVLRPALRRTLAAHTLEEYDSAVSELVAQLQDGHGVFYFNALRYGGLPIRVELIEDKIVVTGTSGGSPFRKRDVIVRIDDVPANELLRERERHISGSPQLRQYRALNIFGRGPLNSVARVEVLRDGASENDNATEKFQLQRTADQRSLFFNPINEFDFPTFAEIRPGIFYVNLKTCEPAMLQRKLFELATAKGIIFDQRWDGRPGPMQPIIPVAHVLPHLINNPVNGSLILIPQIKQPDRVGWTYSESAGTVQPRAPRIKGHVVFINEPSVVSLGETSMAIIAGHHLATLVGAPTAGCNGTANYVPLSNGLEIMWTGMEVLKHDRSPFYATGFLPDHPVRRTLKALNEGRDEYLEKAIEVIVQATKTPH